MFSCARWFCFFLVSALPATNALAQIAFEWPVACKLGETCAVQHYVDRDSGPAAQDYKCGTGTYDTHNGTDIRLRSMAAQAAGVDVLAAAPGRVLRTRSDMRDISVKATGAPSVEGRACGNGVVIAHEDGWETQYCHMAEGSIQVKPGDTIAVGEAIGRIGLSGESEYPHLHFTVRRQGKLVDPFDHDGEPAACGNGRSLWSTKVQADYTYRAGEVLNAGFSAGAVTMADIDAGIDGKTPGREAAALVAYVRAIGLRKGDVQRLSLAGPDGQRITDSAAPPLDNNKAQYMMFAGKKRPGSEWPAGEYVATYGVTRAGQVVLEKRFSLKL